MALTYDELPNDAESLKHLVLGREQLIAQLSEEISRLKRWRFGRSAEKMDDALPQQLLALGDVPAAANSLISSGSAGEVSAEVPATDESMRSTRSARRPARIFPEHLPRETVIHQPSSCDCPDCGAQMRTLGQDVSEMLNYVPGTFTVIRHVRPKLACGRCSKVVQLPAPSRPIERGMPAPGLLAQVIVSKYADHCPLYRQAAIYQRSGVQLDRATLSSWIGAASDLLEPVVAALGRHVRSAEKIHADDTPVPVLDPGRGKTKTGRLWTYVRDDRPAAGRAPPAVWYRYSPDRKGEHPQRHLRNYRGILQADAYSGFQPLYVGGRIVEAGCWAHSRRKFYDLHVATQSPIAAEAIRRIGLLYAVEREIRGQAAEARAAARQARSAPVLRDLHVWLGATLQTVSAKSSLAQAIQYTLVRWPAMTRFCDDGRIEMDNNSAERSIRAIVLGRRNYLFAGADTGGQRAANLYSLIATCLLNGIEPYAYLRHVLERIADHPINRVETLLPWHVAEELVAPLRQAA